MDWSSQRVVMTGGAGFLGSAVARVLETRGAREVVIVRSKEFDLTKPEACERLMSVAKPTVVIHCAGFVGGLGANRKFPARFFHDNLLMGANLIEACRTGGLVELGGVFVQVGTMCSYPASAPVPYREETIFDGLPDPEIASYGIAKRALLQMLRAYQTQHGMQSVCVIPVNLYGPGDNIDNPDMSHAAGAMIKRFVEAAAKGDAQSVCWGSGAPTRDFLYVDDAAEGVVRAAEAVRDASHINLGSGKETSIRELAETTARLAGYTGRIVWDTSKGDGVSRRVLDVSRARERLGWSAVTPLEHGLERTLRWYVARR